MSEIIDLFIGIYNNTDANKFATFSGWFVAVLMSLLFVWRLKVWDAHSESQFNKIENKLDELRKDFAEKLDEMDDVTTSLISDQTKTSAILAEKIGSIQMVMMQMLGSTPKRR